jgi:ubiquinone/menaquinone biosynthesis C-methylase UbiE
MRGIEHVPWLYDAFMRLMEPFGLARWRRRLVAAAGGRVLEVGCGTGLNLPLYADGCRPVAVDPDYAVLRAARRRAPDVPLAMARAEALPFRGGTFDTVVSSLVFCSVDDPRHGLAELGRVLRPGGTLRMLEHVRHRNRLLARVQDVAQPAWTWLTGGCRPNRDTEAEVERAGFRIIASTRRASGAMRLFSASPPAPTSSSWPGTWRGASCAPPCRDAPSEDSPCRTSSPL